MAIERQNLVSDKTAARIQELIRDKGGQDFEGIKGGGNRAWVIVQCDDTFPLDTVINNIKQQLYPAHIIQAAADFQYPPLSTSLPEMIGSPVLLTVLGEGGQAVEPILGGIYSGPLLGDVAVDKDTSEGRPRVIAHDTYAFQGKSWKATVRAATTTALPSCVYDGTIGTIEGASNGALPSQDGVSLAVGDSLLVKDENAFVRVKNGIYTVRSLGSGGSKWLLKRRADMAKAAQFPGAVVVVLQGNTRSSGGNNDLAFICTNDTPPNLTDVNAVVAFIRFAPGVFGFSIPGVYTTGNLAVWKNPVSVTDEIGGSNITTDGNGITCGAGAVFANRGFTNGAAADLSFGGVSGNFWDINGLGVTNNGAVPARIQITGGTIGGLYVGNNATFYPLDPVNVVECLSGLNARSLFAGSAGRNATLLGNPAVDISGFSRTGGIGMSNPGIPAVYVPQLQAYTGNLAGNRTLQTSFVFSSIGSGNFGTSADDIVTVGGVISTGASTSAVKILFAASQFCIVDPTIGGGIIKGADGTDPAGNIVTGGLVTALGSGSFPTLPGTNTFTGPNTFHPSSSSTVPLTMQGASGQTANLMDVRDNGGSLLASISASGAMTAASFTGSGAGLTSLNASNLASGTIPSGRIGVVDGGSL